jgi:hypothetical protein
VAVVVFLIQDNTIMISHPLDAKSPDLMGWRLIFNTSKCFMNNVQIQHNAHSNKKPTVIIFAAAN